jgi:hypothetical protein
MTIIVAFLAFNFEVLQRRKWAIVYLLCIVLIVLISLDISMIVLSINLVVYYLMSKIIARVAVFNK